MPLRYYQADARRAVGFAIQEFDSVLMSTPTGSGKTVTGAHIIADLLPGRSLFLADSDELCSQPLTVIDREIGVIPALHKARKRASLLSKVVVGSSQTFQRKAHLEFYPEDHFKFIVVDEAHRGAERDKKICDYFRTAKRIGMTATPFTSHLQDLSKYYEEVAYHMPMLDLMNEGFMPVLKVLTLPVEIDLANVATSRSFGEKDYELESLSTTIAPYYIEVIKLLKEHATGRHIIVYLPLISSSKAFAALAREAGITAIHVDGTDPERDEKIESFKAGRIQMLCNSDLLSTGVDMPIADCMVNLSPLRSMSKYQQRAGRFLRVLPGVIDDIPEKHQAEERKARIAASAKPDALIIDFLWQHDQLGVMRPGHLVAPSAEDASAMFEKVRAQRTPEDLQRIAKLVQEEREAAIVKRLEQVATYSGKRTIEPAAFGLLIGSNELMKYEPIKRWEMEEPSAAQLEKLSKWGLDAEKITSKGLASKLMSTCLHRFKMQLATTNQLRALKKRGLQFDPWKVTIKEASRMLAQSGLEAVRK